MTQEDLDVLAGFGAVWERVSGERIDSPPVSCVTWEDVLDGLYRHFHGCRGLAAGAVGEPRRRLMRLSAETKRLLRRLETEYYLETGDIFISVNEESFASYTPYNLRKLCKNAVNLAGLLQKGAENRELSVGDAWKTVSDHAQVLKSLLGACLQ